jgi:hypothetical protein
LQSSVINLRLFQQFLVRGVFHNGGIRLHV